MANDITDLVCELENTKPEFLMKIGKIELGGKQDHVSQAVQRLKSYFFQMDFFINAIP